jgi:hypothetical protein
MTARREVLNDVQAASRSMSINGHVDYKMVIDLSMTEGYQVSGSIQFKLNQVR